VVTGSGGDELAAGFGQDPGDRLGIFPAQRLAGENDDAGIDILCPNSSLMIGRIDDRTQSRVVDAMFVVIRRQADRRFVERLPRDDDVAAGEIFPLATKMNARKNDLRARRSDVDADRAQRHEILLVDRVLVERPFFEIMLVVGVDAMVVGAEIAEPVISKRMRRRRFSSVLGLVHALRLVPLCRPPSR